MKKTKILDTVNEFNNEIDLNELFERLLVVEKIERGLAQIDAGETVAHEKVVDYFKRKWQK